MPRFILNDENVMNSYGFKIKTAGIYLTRFEANPVMLDGHNPSNFSVIGRWKDIKVEDGKLSADTDFDMEDENAKTIAGKVERGMIKGASMGISFSKKDFSYQNGELVLEKCSLHEASIVAIRYKLAGFEHLGGVEIDPEMAKIYMKNHNPKYFYLENIREFNQRKDLPDELYNLDILDDSPPCTTFSMTGKREQGWGREKYFKEGQKKQTLDDLVFVYCDPIKKLHPKVAVLENVSGIIAGNTKKYSIEIVEKLNDAGYEVQIFQLNAATMGVPQSRERVFFIARRKDLNFKPLILNFDEKPVPFGVIADKGSTTHKPFIKSIETRMPLVKKGEVNFKYADARYRNLKTYNAFFSSQILYDDRVAPTLTSSGESVYWEEKRNINDTEYIRMSSFPADFDFCGQKVRYVCGMSVPPLMTLKIAEQIKKQWLQ